MARELPFLKYVGNDIVRVELPQMDDADRTYLAAAPAAGAVAITVLDNTILADNDYLMIGNPGDDTTEIVQVNAVVTRGTAVTVTATVFAHSIDEPVTKLEYNRVAIYGSASADDAGPTIIGALTDLDVAKGYQELPASTTYAFYYARYNNEETGVFSEYSTSVAAAGHGRNSAKVIIDKALDRTQSKLDDAGVLSKNYLLDAFNDWQDWVLEAKRDWAWLRTNNHDSLINLAEDTQNYTLPTDLQDDYLGQSLIRVGVRNNCWLSYVDPEDFFCRMEGSAKTYVTTQFIAGAVTAVVDDIGDFSDTGSLRCEGDVFSYTGRTIATNTFTGVTGVDDTHEVDREVWQNPARGTPTVYTVADVAGTQTLMVWPIPDNTLANDNLYLEYWSSITAATDWASTTPIPFTNSGVYYVMAKIEEAKGDPRQMADKHMARAEAVRRAALQKELSERHNTVRTFAKPRIAVTKEFKISD